MGVTCSLYYFRLKAVSLVWERIQRSCHTEPIVSFAQKYGEHVMEFFSLSTAKTSNNIAILIKVLITDLLE